MLKSYVGTKIINAEPAAHKDGRPGYDVYYPDGYASWSPQATFEAAYREITGHERQVMNMTEAEASVARISDGDPDQRCTHVSGEHQFGPYSESRDAWVCDHCDVERFTHPTTGAPPP